MGRPGGPPHFNYSYFRSASTAFNPPKAKEFESAYSTCCRARLVGNHVQVALRVGLVEIGGGRQHAVAQRQRGGQALQRGGGAQRVAVHRLGGTHRQPVRVRAETARMAAVSVGSLASVAVPCALM